MSKKKTHYGASFFLNSYEFSLSFIRLSQFCYAKSLRAALPASPHGMIMKILTHLTKPLSFF